MHEGGWDNRGGNVSWGRCNALDGSWWGIQAGNESAGELRRRGGICDGMGGKQHRGPIAMLVGGAAGDSKTEVGNGIVGPLHCVGGCC